MFRLILIFSLGVLTTAPNINGSRIDVFEMMMDQQPHTSHISPRDIQVGWITQKLNHFDLLDDRTWQQRYFYSSDAYTPGGPVFFFIFGELEATPNWISNNIISEMAIENGAITILLEHRFYGESRPFENTSTPNLKYLSADAALEDAAFFTQHMMTNFNLTGPWIAFGMSYSANLAAWARARYPHLYYAAYSSSGPVLAKLDNFEFFEVVNEAFLNTMPVCPLVIEEAMNELVTLVEAGDADLITETFNLCEKLDLSNPNDVMTLYFTIAFFLGSEVQGAIGDNLERLCQTLSDGQTNPLKTLGEIITKYTSPNCLVSVHQQILQKYQNDLNYSWNPLRRWYYQTCVEFGFWQSLSSPDQPFGQLVPVEFNLLWCTMYGPEYTRELNEAGIARTNLINGGLTPDVTRVLYTHGTLDPWARLGIQSQLNNDNPVILIQGASHIRDLMQFDDRDSQAVEDARVVIRQIIRNWVIQANLG